MKEICLITSEVSDYFFGAIQKVKPFFVLLATGVNYVLFPDKAYIPAAIGLGGALILDILTKYYALQKPHKGLLKAIKAGTICSEKFWIGTKKKIISYLVVMILCGLSIRVAPIAALAIGFSTVAYSVMFLREAQSCIENLIAAGHEDLKWFLFILKRKQKNILESEESNNKDKTNKKE
jgi:phage-related holin